MMSQNPIRRTPRPADTGKLEGLPILSFVVCDNGREFVGRTLREACNLLSISIERPVLRKKIGKVEAEMRSQRLLDKVERVCLHDSLAHGTNANTEYAVAGAKTGTEPCLPRPATFHLAFHW